MREPAAPTMGLLLAGSLCLLPFLIPYHQLPVLSFYPEWLAVALGTAAALVVLAGHGASTVSLPVPARWLVAFTLFLVIRAAVGDQAYFQLPLLAALYVLYSVLMIRLGAQLAATFGIERVAVVLAAFLLAGALANSMAGVIQFYGRPKLLEDLIADLSSRRAYGNIAQANLYANYLALGMGALLFLWLRRRVRTAYALCALTLLAAASALSDSRAVVLYALWYALLGWIATCVQEGRDTRHLGRAAYCVAGAALAAYFAVPRITEALGLGPPGIGDRLLDASGQYAEPRGQAFLLALRAFVDAPIAGVGMGEFAGAAFVLGLDPSLTRSGEVWTSPHNLPLHLLAETGTTGAALVLCGLCAWGWQAARRYRADPQPALWWLVSAAGLQLVHSLVEFPLWSAHFLGVAALLIGASTMSESPSPAVSRAGSIGVLTACATLSVSLALTLRDYVRLDSARFTGTTLTLAPAAQSERDSATMRELSRGLLAPVAELWIFLGAPLDHKDLASKLAMSARVVRTWPANAVVVRHSAFLALDGEAERAQMLLERALRTFPQRRDDTISILDRARVADPYAIEPLLATAGYRPPAVEPQR